VHLSFILAESALELVPKDIQRSPAVLSDSRRRGIDPAHILLDRSFHHSAMARLDDGEKRGRPDLVHAALLSVTGTPLYLDGSVKAYVHTCQNLVLEIEEKTRIPKSYLRFRGLVEKLLLERPQGGLVKVHPAGMRELVRRIVAPGLVVGLSTQGGQMRLEELARMLVTAGKPCLVVGGFPHGHFSPETLRLIDRLVRIDARPLEAHVVAARAVYEVEKAAGRFND
jgi:rRNA small subunit pseudouridine methyltransferase Nep1